MKKFNAAIIGCGTIHSFHANALKSISNADLYRSSASGRWIGL
jgi:predicted dehydrogenase